MKGGVGFAIGGLENLAEKENLELAGNKKWTARKMPRNSGFRFFHVEQ